MAHSPDNPQANLVGKATVFELALAVLGGLAIWLGRVPLDQLCPAAGRWPHAVGWGLLATLPLWPMLAAMTRSRWPPIVRLRRLVEQFVGQIFGQATPWRLAALSLAAGIGEEILFRGALQPLAIRYSSPVTGILIASLVFGAVHAVTRTYFVLAMLIGVYFGWLAHWRGEIVSAAVAHAVYDFVALLLVTRRTGDAQGDEDSPAESADSTSEDR